MYVDVTEVGKLGDMVVVDGLLLQAPVSGATCCMGILFVSSDLVKPEEADGRQDTLDTGTGIFCC